MIDPKKPIVYLPPSVHPMSIDSDFPVFKASDVYDALDTAGVKWAQESPEEHQIRMLKLQIEELKVVCAKLQRELKEAQAENGSLAGLMADTQKHVDELYAKNEELERAYLEIQDENAVLKDRNAAQEKTTIRHLGAMGDMDDENEKLKQAYLELQEKHSEEIAAFNLTIRRDRDAIDELHDENEALKMTAQRAQEELKAMKDHNAVLKMTIRQYQEGLA